VVLGLEPGLDLQVHWLGSEAGVQVFCSGPSAPASLLEGILEAVAGKVAAVALAQVSVKEERCSVAPEHSRVPLVVPSSVERYSPFPFQDEGHIPLSPSYASALGSRSYGVHACPPRHKNGSGHAFDRESGDVHGSVFAHENACVHENVCVGWAGVNRPLAEDRIPPREGTALS
jgi:hypothetical protein